MKLSEYLLDRIFSLICMLVAALVLLALLWLIETPAVFILFAEVILLAAYSTALLYDFFRKQSFYNLLQKMTEQMDIKTLLGELMVPPHFLEGQILVDVLRCCNKYQNDQLACAEQENREYREYLDSWVHEIKTPITSARLIVENEKNPTHCELTMNCGKLMLMWSRCYITPAVPMWKRTLRWRKPPCRHWCTLR